MVLLFFAWGFINANNDPLIANLLRSFNLSFTQGISVQLVSFLAFTILSLPLARLLSRIGFAGTIFAGLTAMATGCLIVGSAAWVGSFALVLGGLFVLAGGIVALQVAANPLAADMGPPARSHFRLTLAQSFNALGAVLGVHYGAWSMLRSDGRPTVALSAVGQAFGLIALSLLIVGLFILTVRRQLITDTAPDTPIAAASHIAAWRSPWAIGGAIAIALYVGAEVSIGSMLIPYLATLPGFGASKATSASYVANFYWGGALLGRFVGSWLLRRIAAKRLLPVAAIIAASLCALSLLLPGRYGGWCLLSIGLFNSIMFPTIFTLTLERSAAPHASTSGLLCAAIGAGAILPFLAGLLADFRGLHASFAAPLFGYLYVAGFAVSVLRARAQPNSFSSSQSM